MPAPEHELPNAPPAAGPASVADASASAVVIGSDGRTLSTITRHTEHRPDGTAFVVITVTHDVDRDSAPTLRATLSQALEAHQQVCCDFSAVTFFGAAGATTVLDAHRLAAARGVLFTIRGAHGMTREIIEVAGLRDLLRPDG